MKSFVLNLQEATRSEAFTGVTSFVGEDSSGSFGILAGHARMMTSLTIGLARFKLSDEEWQYVAVPGAILYFHDDLLTVSTSRYLIDDDYARISEALQRQLVSEEEKLHAMKKSLHEMEQEVLKRLWEMGRRG